MDKSHLVQLLSGHRANLLTDTELVDQLELMQIEPGLADDLLRINNELKEMNINVFRVIDYGGSDLPDDNLS